MSVDDGPGDALYAGPAGKVQSRRPRELPSVLDLRDGATTTEPLRDPKWPDGAQVAVNLTVDFDAMLLRRLLGEPAMQLGKGEFGGRVGVWRLLDLFERLGVPVTFFVPGRITELYPDAVRAIAAAGHEVADHMWEHQVPADREVERAHLARSLDALERVSGQRPVGSRSWHTPSLMREHGLLYNSIAAHDDRPHLLSPGTPSELVGLPFHFAWDDAQFFNFAWLNSEPSAQRLSDTDRVEELWWNGFRREYELNGYINYCLHPEISGRALRIDMIERLVRRMQDLPGVWFARCDSVAVHTVERLTGQVV